ncbi:MAG: ABC transporter permease [Gemmatimonadaceae bacterium]
MIRFVDDLRQDLRLAGRSLVRARGVALLIIGTLAVGIAVVTTTFSLVNSALYRRLPYPLADRSVAIIASANDWPGNLSAETVELLRHDTHSFARVSALYDIQERFETTTRVETLTGTAVDSGFFATLGARPERGRFPTAAEIAQSAPYAVISHRLWHGALNDDPSVLGQSLRFGKKLYTVVGVMPPRINYGVGGNTDVWVPQPAVADSDSYYFAFAWLKPGVSLAQARAEVGTTSAQLVQSDRTRYRRLNLFVNDEMVVRRTEYQSRALQLFLAIAACVLLIGCANVMTLLLMRATERRREMAVRSSLGASRTRLVRQSLTESLVLAVIAAGLGVALSIACIRLLAATFPVGLGTWFRLGIDTHVLVFVTGLSAAVVLLVGLTPALDGTRLDVSATLKAGGGAHATSVHSLRLGQRAIGIQVAVAVALLISASLLGMSYLNVMHTDLGYHPEGVLAVWLGSGHDQAPPTADARLLTAALKTNPAVQSVARSDEFAKFQDPALTANLIDSIFRTDVPATAVSTGGRPGIAMHVVSDNYFAMLGIPLVRGRTFARGDTAGTPLVAVVSARMAQAIWGGGGDPGRTFRLGRSGTVITAVGIAGDVHDPSETRTGLSTAGHPDIYFSERQATGRGILQLLVRPAGVDGAATSAINEQIRSVTPDLDGFLIRPYEQTMSEASTVLRLFGLVIGICALIALGLALVGIYGAVGYGVAQRTREIGIRMALGGSAPQIRAHVMRGGMRVAAVGLMVGVVLAAGLAQLLRAWMLGVSPTSPLVYLTACTLFAAVAYGAGYVPSRRATRVDPMTALRAE